MTYIVTSKNVVTGEVGATKVTGVASASAAVESIVGVIFSMCLSNWTVTGVESVA